MVTDSFVCQMFQLPGQGLVLAKQATSPQSCDMWLSQGWLIACDEQFCQVYLVLGNGWGQLRRLSPKRQCQCRIVQRIERVVAGNVEHFGVSAAS